MLKPISDEHPNYNISDNGYVVNIQTTCQKIFYYIVRHFDPKLLREI